MIPHTLNEYGDVFPQLYIISMKRRPIQKLFNLYNKENFLMVLYKGRDISQLVQLMISEYNERYHLEAFNGSNVCERYTWIKESAIQAAKDITDIYATN